MSEKPHSWYVINDQRLGWWSAGQLKRFVDDVKPSSCERLLDVGCGAGHWTETLARWLPSRPRQVSGIDIEQHWLDQFDKRLSEAGATVSIYREDVHRFPDVLTDFDIVTCQTLLMHCHNPLLVLQNMFNALRPGGHCFVAESLNQINRSVVCEALASRREGEAATLWSFWNSFHSQKIREGAGDNNIAARLPGLLRQAGFGDITAIFNERVGFESAPFPSLDELKQEMLVEETSRTISQMGRSRDEVAAVASSFDTIRTTLEEEQQTVAHCTPMMLFSCVKPGATPAHRAE